MIELGLSLTNAISGLMGSASILALFAAGEVGVWFEPNDITTLYQDINALTQVAAPGQTCALMLDKSKGLVLGPELVTNGDFSNGVTGWTQVLGAIAAVGGRLRVSRSGGNSGRAVSAALTCVVGRTYRVTLNMYVGTAGTADLYIGISPTSSTGNIFAYATTTDKLATFIFVATQTSHYIGLQSSVAAVDGQYTEFDNVSVAEVPGNHATQPTAAQRPTYGVIPYGGVRNLANGSGAVSDVSYWPAGTTINGVTYTKVGSGVDTDGLPYVDISAVGTASATAFFDVYAFLNSRIAAAVGQTLTTSVLVKVISGTVPPAGCGAVVGVVGETAPATVVENTTSPPIAPSVETQTSLTFTFVNAATNQARCSAYLRTGAGLTANYTIRIKGLQFEKAAARSAFQLNLSKYNVTEAGKASLGVLYPDGIDDGMVTPSIDFSGTNKMTVWAGLQKMSDAAAGMLAELSSNAALVGNTGSFYLSAPNLPLSSDRYGFFSRGSALAVLGQTSLVSNGSAPDVAILTALGDISSDVSSLNRNGAAGTNGAADQGTGNYGNYPLYLFRRGGTSLPFNGIFTGLIVRGAQSSAAQISNTNAFMNSELGAY